jgi:hypothetical protein
MKFTLGRREDRRILKKQFRADVIWMDALAAELDQP